VRNGRTPLHRKSSVDEIRARFDQDVERFSDLKSGQAAAIDAPLAMELIASAARAATDPIERVLDIGCGAGNQSLKLLGDRRAAVDCDLCDLSAPMLQAAERRVSAATEGTVTSIQGDIRDIELEPCRYDVVLAGAVLHHLREDLEWERLFEKLYDALRPGGSLWISDLVAHESSAVDSIMWSKYAQYLEDFGGPQYREEVFAYIDHEDSPKPMTFQLRLLDKAGFRSVDVLHKNAVFAAFGAVK